MKNKKVTLNELVKSAAVSDPDNHNCTILSIWISERQRYHSLKIGHVFELSQRIEELQAENETLIQENNKFRFALSEQVLGTPPELEQASPAGGWQDAVGSKPLCAHCGDDRTGKGSLISKDFVFCSEGCYYARYGKASED